MKRFRGGLIFEAHRLLYYSTLGLRATKKKAKRRRGEHRDVQGDEGVEVLLHSLEQHLSSRAVSVIFFFFITLKPRVE